MDQRVLNKLKIQSIAVVTNRNMPNEEDVLSGIAQGTVLAFTVYNNDI